MKTLLFSVTTVFALIAGVADGGEVKHVNAKEAIELFRGENKPKVLDVRTAEEFAEGHLEGATNIDFQKSDFEEKLTSLEKSKTYLIHCRSGFRSGKSLAVFKKLGFQNIIHLDGGIKAWQEAGGKVKKPK